MTLEIGDKAPAFKLKNDRGETVKLAQFKGQKVVLYFYPKDDTPGCTAQACDFRDNMMALQGADAIALGISPDSVESHAKFKKKYALNFALLSDPDHQVAELYGAWGEKNNYGKKYMGIIRSHFVIDEKGKLLDVRRRVPAKDSARLALRALVKTPQ